MLTEEGIFLRWALKNNLSDVVIKNYCLILRDNWQVTAKELITFISGK